MKSQHLVISLFLGLLPVAFSCDCDDPSDPKCSNYNPCYPYDCDSINDSEGTIIVDKVFSQGLESNLLSDNPERKVSIYLPPDYDTETSKSYPVLYLLHGYLCDHDTWFGGELSEEYGENGLNMKKMLDTLIQKNHIEPMIVVSPSSRNAYDGSWYTNSMVSGNWEDFITEDVVNHVDTHYRTLPEAESRGIAGHSMGAYGAIKLAMKHPDIYSSVYAMSGALYIEDFMEVNKEYILAALQENSYPSVSFTPEEYLVRILIAMSAAFAPNPDMEPFLGEFPYSEEGTRIDSTWQKWVQQDPMYLLNLYVNNMKQLEAIRLDCGNRDDSHPSNKAFSDALTAKGIEHIFETYTGNHNNKIPERLANEVLPYFSEHLDHSEN